MANPNNSSAFSMFPIPKYLKNKNVIKDKEIIIPLLVFAKTVAKEKSSAINKTIKKIGIIPKVSGSIK